VKHATRDPRDFALPCEASERDRRTTRAEARRERIAALQDARATRAAREAEARYNVRGR
jgi:hypothetical protein